MKNSTKILLALGAGALAGGIAGFYLNSDKGRKARKDAVKNIRETAQQASDKMTEMAESAKTAIGEVAVQAKTYMTNLVKSADETFENGKEAFKAKVKSVEKAMVTSNGEVG